LFFQLPFIQCYIQGVPGRIYCTSGERTWVKLHLYEYLYTSGFERWGENDQNSFKERELFEIYLLLNTLYVPVTVHREQSVKKEYQQNATI